MAKTHEVRIKLSKKEYETIKSKADGVGMNITSFLRFLGIGARIEIST